MGFFLSCDDIACTLILLQALDGAMKHLKSLPNTAAMLFSVDQEDHKLVCHCQVPNVSSWMGRLDFG